MSYFLVSIKINALIRKHDATATPDRDGNFYRIHKKNGKGRDSLSARLMQYTLKGYW